LLIDMRFTSRTVLRDKVPESLKINSRPETRWREERREPYNLLSAIARVEADHSWRMRSGTRQVQVEHHEESTERANFSSHDFESGWGRSGGELPAIRREAGGSSKQAYNLETGENLIHRHHIGSILRGVGKPDNPVLADHKRTP